MTHSLSDIAEKLNVSIRTIRKWVSSGELRAVNVSRNRSSRRPRLRVTDADFQAFLAGRTVGGAPKPRRRRRVRPVREYV